MSGWRKKIGAITLFVEDPDRSKAFYREVFELEPMLEDEASAGFQLEDMFLFLTRSSHAAALIADDVDAVCAELTRKGIALLNGPQDREWGMRTANFQDPDGYVWEIATPVAGTEG
ncbi:MAG TPA: VOC family protein [Streptosporangiaceae bacterium]|nr:VOC family protein [Streptosporangiaceae bacterium]